MYFWVTKLNNDVVEGLKPLTNQNIDLPITTTYVPCKNVCGPIGTCENTGNQCVKDTDCKGCINNNGNKPEPSQKKYLGYNSSDVKNNYRGETSENDNITPLQNNLETSLVKNASQIEKNQNSIPPHYNKGHSTWTYPYNIGMELFAKRENPRVNNYVKYTNKYTLTGDFVTNMPPSYNS
jgi:hypothetical protein|tara:strand:- start:20075 stop:20614 length:540 start_codon:yes stop_codon:yes gene_type:complete